MPVLPTGGCGHLYHTRNYPLINYRSGALHVGDQLLSINGQQLEGRTLLEARHMMAHSDINVILEVIPSHNLTSERLESVSRGEDRISDSVSRASHSIEACDYMRKPSRCTLV